MNEVIPYIGAPSQSQNWIDSLSRAMPDECVIPFLELSDEQRQRCSVAIVANPDPAALAQLPNLRWVHSVWAGVERLVANANPGAFEIVRLVDPQLANTMAEAVLAWTLFLHRDIPLYAAQQKQLRWLALPCVQFEARTVSIMGLGAMGSAAAMILTAVGFKVQGWSRRLKEIPGVHCFAGEDGLQKMLMSTDILVCLLPLTAQTTGLLNAERLALLPEQAGVINFGRGPIIDEQALRNALDNGNLKHAVLDVFNTEPLPPESWQWQHPRVTVLPHCAAVTNTDTASAIVARHILQYRMTGQIPAGVSVELGY